VRAAGVLAKGRILDMPGINGQLLRIRYLVSISVLVHCEIFTYRQTMTHEPLKASYFAVLVYCSVLY
jgi:hypothetical protein